MSFLLIFAYTDVIPANAGIYFRNISSILKQYYVYILASKTEVLYIGVTSDLIKRVYEHKNKLVEGFTQKYNVDRLVYYEVYQDINEAIKREKQMKQWIRQYKINIITDFNPTWSDLYEKILS